MGAEKYPQNRLLVGSKDCQMETSCMNNCPPRWGEKKSPDFQPNLPCKQSHCPAFSVFSCHLAAAQGCYEARPSNWPGGKITWQKRSILVKWRPTWEQEEAASIARTGVVWISNPLEKMFACSSTKKPCKFRNFKLLKQINALSTCMVNTAQRLQLGQLLPWIIQLSAGHCMHCLHWE